MVKKNIYFYPDKFFLLTLNSTKMATKKKAAKKAAPKKKAAKKAAPKKKAAKKAAKKK